MKLNGNIARMVGAACMAATIAFGSTIRPAAADQAAVTRNTILGVAAAIALGVTAANVAHKDAVANTVEGYTPDGGAVYQDGHVVLPNGQSYYPGNYGQSISCNDGSCGVYGGNYGYGAYGSNANNGYNGYNGYYGPSRRYPQGRR